MFSITEIIGEIGILILNSLISFFLGVRVPGAQWESFHLEAMKQNRKQNGV